ncbi:hypothetical protein T492DRAFT_952361 [Pavlovales sp. CCMP2436]|nr:hypothetical protein T492DRAFT_952361 [Pavlovales sp. CCMP2436]
MAPTAPAPRAKSSRIEKNASHFLPFAELSRLRVEQPSLKVERLSAESDAEWGMREHCFKAPANLVLAQLKPLYAQFLLPVRGTEAATSGSVASGPARAPSYVHLDGDHRLRTALDRAIAECDARELWTLCEQVSEAYEQRTRLGNADYPCWWLRSRVATDEVAEVVDLVAFEDAQAKRAAATIDISGDEAGAAAQVPAAVLSAGLPALSGGKAPTVKAEPAAEQGIRSDEVATAGLHVRATVEAEEERHPSAAAEADAAVVARAQAQHAAGARALEALAAAEGRPVHELLVINFLKFCNLGGLDATVWATGLRHLLTANAALTTLNFDGNQIGDAGAVGLGKALKANTALTTLDLHRNQIGDVGALGLAKALEVNASLTELDLNSNLIGDAGALGLGKALEVNGSLTSLDLDNNQIGEKGALGLANALKVNASLTELYLDSNQIGDAGAVGLAKALEVNGSLTTLCLDRNQIGDAGALGLAKALEVNDALTTLELGWNQIGDASKSAIRTAWLSKTSRKESDLHLHL